VQVRRPGVWLQRSLIVAAQSTQAVGVATVALFLPVIRDELGLTFSQAGLLAAVPVLTYALMQMPAGLLADRLDPRVLFGAGVAATNASGIFLTVSSAFPFLLTVQAVAGAARAFMFVPGLLLITRQFSEARRASAMGLLFAGGLSAYVTVNLLGPVLGGRLGWRGFLVLMSGVGLGLLLAFWLLSPATAPGSRRSPAGPSRRWVWARSAWWLLGVVQFARMGIAVGFLVWLPTFLVVEHDVPLRQTGLVVALAYAVAALSNIGGGVVADRWNASMPVIGVSLGMLAVLLATVGHIRSVPLLVAALVTTAVFLQLYFGPLFTVPQALFGSSVSGLSVGFGNFCANLGGFAASLGIGVVLDVTGSFVLAFLCLTALAVVALAAFVALVPQVRASGPAGGSGWVGPEPA
jgi:predicted MFS family arabinose efflux permease